MAESCDIQLLPLQYHSLPKFLFLQLPPSFLLARFNKMIQTNKKSIYMDKGKRQKTKTSTQQGNSRVPKK